MPTPKVLLTAVLFASFFSSSLFADRNLPAAINSAKSATTPLLPEGFETPRSSLPEPTGWTRSGNEGVPFPNRPGRGQPRGNALEKAPDIILVKMRSQDALRAAGRSLETAPEIVVRVLGKAAAQGVEQVVMPRNPVHLGKPNPAGLAAARASAEAEAVGLYRWHRVRLVPGMAVDRALGLFLKDPSIETAEPEYIFRPLDVDMPGPGTDPRFPEQWALQDARVPAAWVHLKGLGLPPGGSRDVVVAVIDTGVDYRHDDLSANMWVNAREAKDGVDNDGNGFVDDMHGIDVTAGSTLKRGDPRDDHGHGTHVAGIIAAEGLNGRGGVGVAFNVRIMAIKAAQYSGVLAASQVAQGIYYAVENGADVINMSFGGYGRSTLMENALGVAFGQAVLVAAAGNDGKSNGGECDPGNWGVMYPAGYNWVLGVMAHQPIPEGGGDWLASFSNYDCTPGDSVEYELMAPGVGVLSTLPGNSYSSWSGTSMAAPVVSGVAALLRTRWPDKEVYSSRFLMAQLASTGTPRRGKTLRNGRVVSYPALDALAALTNTPKPSVSFLQRWIFDPTSLSATNDNDSVVDAGETIDLAIEFRNQWGLAANIVAKLEPQAPGVVGPDPFVTMLSDTILLGSLGSFNQKDSGLIRDAAGAVVGVTNAFRFRVAADTPNEHLIPFRLTITASNGLNAADPISYTTQSAFSVAVQKGRLVPTIITQDLVLDANTYWIVDRPVLIPQGITVTVTEGAQVQFWSSEPGNVYANQLPPVVQVEGILNLRGSAEKPVALFPGNLYARNSVWIRSAGGRIDMTYFHAVNAIISGVEEAHYGLLEQNYWDIRGPGAEPACCGSGAVLNARAITHTIFRNCGSIDKWSSYGLQVGAERFHTNLLDHCHVSPPWWDADRGGRRIAPDLKGCVFLGNHRPPAPPENYHLISRYHIGSPDNSGLVVQNAFLNEWWRTGSSDYWARFNVPVNRGSAWYITSNYWGTTSRQLIDYGISDNKDDFNLGEYVYEPILETAPEACWPFVVSVRLDTSSATNVTSVGAEQVAFTVSFNRDMSTNTQPNVSFGPAVPYTDFTVRPQEGWLNPRTWKGVCRISPIIGDGWQYVRVTDAVAVDDPWLVLGNEIERFRFEVKTSGLEALSLQASAGEGYVDLSWLQDDFDLLAGYNLYRSASSSGPFTRVNSFVIPREQKNWRDTDVRPGQSYFYKFTVVKTDFTESQFSNMAVGTPLDTIPPVVSHTPVTTASPNLSISLTADVTDNVAVQGVSLLFRAAGTVAYQDRAMVRTTGNRYSATLSGSEVTTPGIDYYIEATDGIGLTRSGSPDAPYGIVVSDAPVITSISPLRGPSAGGTVVTIAGSNLKPGTAVFFGDLPALQVQVQSASRITCVTPASFPTVADVRVTDTNSQSAILLRAFTYDSDAARLSLPLMSGGHDSVVTMPLSIDNAVGIVAVDAVLAFDPAILQPVAIRKGNLVPNWTMVPNTNTPGRVRFSTASPGGMISGAGVLLYCDFRITGAPASQTALTIQSALLNDGAVAATLQNGSLTVDATYSISGQVAFWNSAQPVSNVRLSLAGARMKTVTNGSSGSFALQGLDAGAWELIPAKADQVVGVSAYDASLILQHAAGLSALSGGAAMAADVNQSGSINAMDAFLVLQKVAGLIEGPFPGAGVAWLFSPRSRVYPDLRANLAQQDFQAILLGDVSGNWSANGIQDLEASSLTNTITEIKPLRTNTWVTRVFLAGSDPRITSLEFTLSYNTNAILHQLVPGPLLQEYASAFNTATPGVLRLALAGARPLPGQGLLLTVAFDGPAAPELTMRSYSLNENRYSLASSVSIVPFDADSDGLSDVDEIELFHTDPTLADSSGDGVQDGVAVRLGLDPADPSSRFVIGHSQRTPDGRFILTWPARPGNVYRLEYSETPAGTWRAWSDSVVANSYTATVTLPTEVGSTRFYRVVYLTP